MALKTVPITKEIADKIGALHRGEIPRPRWIDDWDAKIEDCTRRLAAAVSQQLLTLEQQRRYMQAIVKMKFHKDHLCAKWMQDIPHKTWEDLTKERPPSQEDLWQYTVVETEDFLVGPGLPAFVLFLDGKWKGFLKDFAHACLRECDPLLEESVELTPEVRRTLSYPAQAFGTDHREVLESKFTEWMGQIVPEQAPEYVHRLLAANAMVALGNEVDALSQLEFARCEAACPEFGELMRNSDPRADQYLIQTQHWQIEVLLKLWPS